jgi:hypothetical protein
MNEEFLHYVWKQELFKKEATADTGEKVEIISPGLHNKDAGPDFLNARIKINDTIWAGNVEIHSDASSWDKHGHSANPAYNNVILHVVEKQDYITKNFAGRRIPTIALEFDLTLYKNYAELLKGDKPVPCNHSIQQVNGFVIKMWLDSLIIERLEDKTEYIKSVLENTNNSWEDTFYIILAKNFGFKINSLPFELLAKSIPLKILSKYRQNIHQLEALLFGQAGFLEANCSDEYFITLKKEYDYLKKAHQLKSIENSLWKFLRLRPSNFPTIRIAQFAYLVNKSQHLFSKTIEAKNTKELFDLFSCGISEYWKIHYNFGKPSKKTERNFGKASLLNLFINTVIPFLFLYGKLRGIISMQEKAISFLEQFPAEKNHIIESWSEIGLSVENALQGQALLQLTNKYCSLKNCLYCQIGNEIIRKQNSKLA